MKNLGIIIVLVILGIIFYMLWGKTQDKPTVVNRTVTPLNIRGVDSVRNTIATQKWKEAEDKLRKVAGAAEAYWVENNRYPETDRELTTPIAYLKEIPKDPFTQDNTLGYKKLDKHTITIWSIGPDAKDNIGEMAYDPTNGVFSEGDILVFKKAQIR
jgi:hypothetical protein